VRLFPVERVHPLLEPLHPLIEPAEVREIEGEAAHLRLRRSGRHVGRSWAVSMMGAWPRTRSSAITSPLCLPASRPITSAAASTGFQ